MNRGNINYWRSLNRLYTHCVCFLVRVCGDAEWGMKNDVTSISLPFFPLFLCHKFTPKVLFTRIFSACLCWMISLSNNVVSSGRSFTCKSVHFLLILAQHNRWKNDCEAFEWAGETAAEFGGPWVGLVRSDWSERNTILAFSSKEFSVFSQKHKIISQVNSWVSHK